jgi:hypothetical protein
VGINFVIFVVKSGIVIIIATPQMNPIMNKFVVIVALYNWNAVVIILKCALVVFLIQL